MHRSAGRGLAVVFALLAISTSVRAQELPVLPQIPALPRLGSPVPVDVAAPGPVVTPVPADPAPPPAPDKKPKFEMSWNNGLFFATADKEFSFHAGATLQYDFAFYKATPILQDGPRGTKRFQDGVNLRRGRFFFEGTVYDNVDYKFEMEFFNGIGFSPPGSTGLITTSSVTNSPGPTDAWITIKDVPLVGNVRIGSQKEWWSLEHLNTYRALEFMERSYLFDFSQPTAFDNGFSPGVSMFRTWANDRIFSAIGAYKNESDLLGFGIGNGQYAATGRLAATPIWQPDDQTFWHIGGAMTHRDPVDGRVLIRLRNNIRNAPFPLLNLVAFTDAIPTESQTMYNLETAAVYGSWTFQAEYTANVLNGTSIGGQPLNNLFFQACYAEALFLLTGESRTWNTKYFFFNRVVPNKPLRFKRNPDCEDDRRGCGAWEVGVRYTYVDLSNRDVRDGRLDSVTLGLTWYLNTNAKLQWNYDLTHKGDTATAAQGTIHAFGTRMQIDF